MMPTQVRCLKVGDMFGESMDFTQGKVYNISAYLGGTTVFYVVDDLGDKVYINTDCQLDGKWRFIHPTFTHNTGE